MCLIGIGEKVVGIDTNCRARLESLPFAKFFKRGEGAYL